MGDHICQDRFILVPFGSGWVLFGIWASYKTSGPLLHPGGEALRKAKVEFLADLARWAFAVEVKWICRGNKELFMFHTLESESNLVHCLTLAGL